MRLTRIEISSLAAFKTFAADLPAVSLISGRNGLGKSSLLNVIKYAFGRRASGSNNSRGIEHDPRLLHGDAERGEATITFDDGSQLRVVVTKDSTERMLKAKDGKRWTRSTKEIDDIANALSYDPLQFKTMPEKQRVETLLRIMPVPVTAEEIQSALGDFKERNGTPVPPSLESINAIYADIYARRTEANREVDTLSKHATELERALPPAAPEGRNWSSEVARLTKQKDNLDAAERAKIETIRKTLETYKEESAARKAQEVQSINSAFNARIKELETERAVQIAATDSVTSNAIEAARAEANKQAGAIKAEFTPLREAVLAELATAQERDRAGQQAEGTRAAVLQARGKATAAKAATDAMTEALTRLTALKAAVASRLPIRGITIAAPKPNLPVDICREENGSLVGFSNWNDADKDTFCLRVAVLSRGACGLVCIDSIADFDPERKKALRAACEKYAKTEGLQFLMGMATSGPLKVSGGPEAWEEE